MAEELEPKKDINWLIVSIAAALLVVLAAYFGMKLSKDEPIPQPTPTASASVTPTPTPTPTVVQSTNVKVAGLNHPEAGTVLAGNLSLVLSRNEWTGRILSIASCENFSTIAPQGVTLKLFKMHEITTVTPSYTGARVGKYFDAISESPCQAGFMWLDVGVAKELSAGSYSAKVGDLEISLTVKNFMMPDRPSMPMYSGLQPYRVILGHKLSGSTHVSVQGPLVKRYVDLLRAHRIEPFAQSIVRPQVKADGLLNLDLWQEFNASYRQLVIDGAIAPVAAMVFDPSFAPADSYLEAVERTIKAVPGLSNAWYYLWDEPTTAQIPTVISRLTQIKAKAPSLRTMVTTAPQANMAGLLDHPVQIFDYFGRSGHWSDWTMFPNYWLYGACPSHGSCANGFTANPTGTPDLMLDQPTIHARMFPLLAAAMGAKAVLYYTVNESYGQIDPWANQYLFGGNGDGTLVLPGITGERGFAEQTPVASLRLKMIRQGMYDVEYFLRAGSADRQLLISNPFTWAKSHDAVEQMRMRAIQ